VTAAELCSAAWMARTIGRGEFSPFTSGDADDLAHLVGTTRVTAGHALQVEDQPIDRIVLVVTGRIALTRRHAGRRVILETLRDGDVFGDLAVLSRCPPPYSADAVTASEVVILEADAFWELIGDRPRLARQFLESLATRFERLQRRLVGLAVGDLRSQVATLVLDETSNGATSLGLAQSTVAELLGATRPSVNRILKELEGDGLVRLGYRRVDVVDVDRLRRAAG